MSNRKIIVVGDGLSAALLDSRLRQLIVDLGVAHGVDIEVLDDMLVEDLVDEVERLGLTGSPGIMGIDRDPWPDAAIAGPAPHPGIKGKRQAQWKSELRARRR